MHATTQFIRYSAVGLISNLSLYFLYLAATYFGMGPKTAMTALYFLGVCITFAFNRNWSFGHLGSISIAMRRYLLIYLFGYVINWTVLYLLVDLAGLPHWWIQGLMILLLAVGLFLLQRFWVFRSEEPA